MPNDFCEVAEITKPASPIATDQAPRSTLLQHYEAIAQASCAMLAAAQSGEWTKVARQEARCCALITTLKAAMEHPLRPADDARRMRLLRQILADDAQIRVHAEPWLAPLAPYITTRRVNGINEAK